MMDFGFDEQAVQNALLARAEALRDTLATRIKQRLSGEVLQGHSGALAASISSNIESNGPETSIFFPAAVCPTQQSRNSAARRPHAKSSRSMPRHWRSMQVGHGFLESACAIQVQQFQGALFFEARSPICAAK